MFNLLENQDLSSDQVAQQIGASPTYVSAFLELLDRKGDGYGNSSLTSRYLVKNKKEYVGDHALHHTNTWASWGRLDEIIKEGKTLLPYETGYADEDQYWSNYMMGQHNRAATGQAYQLVQNVELSNRSKLVDLGGGVASYSIALCEANPQLKSVVVDYKEPLRIARTLVTEHNLQDRISFLEGNAFEVNLTQDYDAALISGVVLITSEEAAAGSSSWRTMRLCLAASLWSKTICAWTTARKGKNWIRWRICTFWLPSTLEPRIGRVRK